MLWSVATPRCHGANRDGAGGGTVRPVTDAAAPETPAACDSCGDGELELTLVRRLYVTPEAWDTPGRVDVGELEWWCMVCRTHYPHEDPSGDGGS